MCGYSSWWIVKIFLNRIVQWFASMKDKKVVHAPFFVLDYGSTVSHRRVENDQGCHSFRIFRPAVILKNHVWSSVRIFFFCLYVCQWVLVRLSSCRNESDGEKEERELLKFCLFDSWMCVLFFLFQNMNYIVWINSGWRNMLNSFWL